MLSHLGNAPRVVRDPAGHPGTHRRKMINVGQIAVLGLGVALLSAQQQEPIFRAATRLVEVTVTVLDKKGNGVTGLGPADFVVLDEGKPRPVALFHFDGGRAAPGAGVPATPPPPGVFTNRPTVTDAAPRNVTALLLDNINTTPLQGVKARALAMRYLATLAPQAVTALYLMENGLYVLHDFTDDAAALRAKVEQARLGSSTAWERDDRLVAEWFNRYFLAGGDMPNLFAQFVMRIDAIADAAIRGKRAERSLAVIEALGTHLAGIPGRKNLVWIGGGFSMGSMTATREGKFTELLETFEGEVRQVSRRLAQQGIALYIVDSHDVETSSDTKADTRLGTGARTNFELLMETRATSTDPRAAMQTMASITGGRYFYSSDATRDAARVVSDLQGSYTLGFYAPENLDDTWHKLKVQVKRSGVSVRHREGYLADSHLTQPLKWTDETWRTVFSNPLASPAIALTADCRRTASGEVALTLRADTDTLQFLPDGENLKANLVILIGDRTPEGLGRASRSALAITVLAAQGEAARPPATYDVTWTPAADATILRVIVQDVNSGRYGSLDVPLNKVPRDRPD
jgi:VWFA-related protein